MKNKRFTRFTMRLWYTFAMSTVNLAMSVTRNQHRPTLRPSHRRWHGGGNEARSAKFHDWQSCIVFYEKTAGLRNEKLGHFISYLNHSKPINQIWWTSWSICRCHDFDQHTWNGLWSPGGSSYALCGTAQTTQDMTKFHEVSASQMCEQEIADSKVWINWLSWYVMSVVFL